MPKRGLGSSSQRDQIRRATAAYEHFLEEITSEWERPRGTRGRVGSGDLPSGAHTRLSVPRVQAASASELTETLQSVVSNSSPSFKAFANLLDVVLRRLPDAWILAVKGPASSQLLLWATKPEPFVAVLPSPETEELTGAGWCEGSTPLSGDWLRTPSGIPVSPIKHQIIDVVARVWGLVSPSQTRLAVLPMPRREASASSSIDVRPSVERAPKPPTHIEIPDHAVHPGLRRKRGHAR